MNPKFRVERPKFIVQESGNNIPEGPKFEIKWHRQLNSSDCGPMAILNLMIADGSEVVSSVVELRQEARNQGWFSSSQVATCLRARGYSAELMSNVTEYDGPREISESDADEILDRSVGTTGILVSRAS